MVLVTGASGFVGRYLVRYLAGRGQTVRALFHSRQPPAELAALPGVEWRRCDLLDVFEVEDALQGVSEIYHCAAVVSFHPSMHDRMLHVNPESTANVVNMALEHQVRKLVHVSSVAALGKAGPKGSVITEDTDWAEASYSSAYGLSKFLAETEVWRGVGEGLNAVVVNPGIVLGAGDWWAGSPQIMQVIGSGFPFYTTGTAAWVDVRDVVRAMSMLMDSSISEERFILSAGNFTYHEVLAMMAGALGLRPPRIRAGRLATGLVWRAARLRSALSGKQPLITRETAHTAQDQLLYDNSKLTRLLPDFAYTPLDETVQTMAAAFRSGHTISS